MSSRARLALIGLLAIGCEQDDLRAPLDLDHIDEPIEDCVTVIHESLELGLELHDYVGDGSGSTGGWALATILDEDLDAPEIALVRVPASPDEPETEPVELGFASVNSARIELRAGAIPGELWVLVDRGNNALLRRLAPGVGVVAGNGLLANFPLDDGTVGCPEEFHRQLLLIEGRPHVLALPDCSESTALELQLLELDPESLQFTTSWVLTFDPCAGDPQCGLVDYPYTLGPIRGGESSQVVSADRIAVGFTQVRDFGGGLAATDVSMLELWLETVGPVARIISFRQVWLTPTNLGTARFAQDLFSIQLHVRNGGSDVDAALLRFDLREELYIQIKTPQLLPFGGPGRLVQLDGQSAMIDVRNGKLEAIPLIDVDSWPNWQPRTLLELDDLIDFEPAGVGQLLLRREQAAPQIVQLRCLG